MSKRTPMMLLGKISILAWSAQARALGPDAGEEAIDPSRIEWIEAENGQARAFVAGGSQLLRSSLEKLERRWMDAGILRINERVMVNAGRVRAVRPLGRRRCEIVLESGMSWHCDHPFQLPLEQFLFWRFRARRAGAAGNPPPTAVY